MHVFIVYVTQQIAITIFISRNVIHVQVLPHTLYHYQSRQTTPDCTRVQLKTAHSIVVTLLREFWVTFDLPRIFVKLTYAHG